MEAYWVASWWGRGHGMKGTMVGTWAWSGWHCGGDMGMEWVALWWGHGHGVGGIVVGTWRHIGWHCGGDVGTG